MNLSLCCDAFESGDVKATKFWFKIELAAGVELGFGVDVCSDPTSTGPPSIGIGGGGLEKSVG